LPLLTTQDDTHEAGEKPAFRVHTANTKLTKAELDSFAEVARTNGVKPSEHLRNLILKAIAEHKDPAIADPIFTEIIGLRMFLANALRSVCAGETMKPKDYDSLIATVRETQQETAEAFAQSYRKRKAI
jgi:hypothetical protein